MFGMNVGMMDEQTSAHRFAQARQRAHANPNQVISSSGIPSGDMIPQLAPASTPTPSDVHKVVLIPSGPVEVDQDELSQSLMASSGPPPLSGWMMNEPPVEAPIEAQFELPEDLTPARRPKRTLLLISGVISLVVLVYALQNNVGSDHQEEESQPSVTTSQISSPCSSMSHHS